MNLSYGLAKTGGAGATDWAFGTDLGIATDSQQRSWGVARTPAKGSAATFTTVAVGSGYTVGKDRTLIQTATDGSGTGLKVIADIVEDNGNLIVGSGLQPTAGFNQFQNSLLLAFDASNPDPYTYARVTATGQAFTGVSNAIPGISATGTAATFIVTVNAGVVTKVTVAAGGTIYRIGDVVTIDKATLELNGSFGGGIIFQGDLKLLVTEDNVLGRIDSPGSTIIQNGGSGHAIGDVITLSEEGSTVVGTGGVTIGTLGIANPVVTAPNNRYPRAVKTSTGVQGTPKTIEFVGMDDVNVIIGGFTAGTIFPFNFKQIIDAGTDAALGEITILY